ncbi:MAG: TonB-dependent receptor [Gammaproteobacteria bacterium]|jgi:iron complex outermembrane receptor protein|nr:TonB-dependent receptor [Gammaproteobacteria bacterium]
MLELAAIAMLATSPTSLEEVVVTARRREERLVDVAASVSRLTPSDLGRLDLTHHAESLNRVPGVLMQRGSGQESLLAIRSPVLTGAGACGAFLFLEDGFPLRPTGFCNVNELFETNTAQAAAVEVLRGPGSVVHGANAVHGVINVLTPSATELEGARISSVFGADEFKSLAFALGDGRQGIQGLVRHDGGFREDSKVTELKLNFLYDRELAGGQLRWRAAATRLDQDTAGFIRGFDSYRDTVLRRSNPNPEAFRDADSLRTSVVWTRSECEGCDDEVRAIFRHSSMTFLQHFLLGKPLEKNAQSSAAIGLARSRPFALEGWSWRAGLDAEWADTSLLEIQDGPTLEGSAFARAIRPAGRHYDYAVEVASIGANAAIEHRSDAWLWRAAIRADHIAYSYDNLMRDGNTAEDGTPCPGGCLYSRPADRDDRFSRLTPRVEVIRHLTERQHVYAVLAEGFRPPEITELYRLQRTQSVADLDAERMRSAELGWRFAFGDDSSPTLRGNLAVFSARKSDVILRDANGFNVIGGRTRHEGVEYELDWQALPRFRVGLGGTFARHRYDFSRAIEGGETITSGRDIDTAPRHLHRLALSAQPHERISIELDVRRVGAYFADAANSRKHPAQTVLGLRGRWQWSPDVALTLEIDNLTDRLLADRADFAQGDWRYFPARRRSAYLGVDWRAR